MGEDAAADSSRFSTRFPNVPCVGFFAGGEIGPRATVGGTGVEGVLRRGVVELQGFTVVFALFIVPARSETDIMRRRIDDGLESVMRHMREKMSGAVNDRRRKRVCRERPDGELATEEGGKEAAVETRAGFGTSVLDRARIPPPSMTTELARGGDNAGDGGGEVGTGGGEGGGGFSFSFL